MAAVFSAAVQVPSFFPSDPLKPSPADFYALSLPPQHPLSFVSLPVPPPPPPPSHPAVLLPSSFPIPPSCMISQIGSVGSHYVSKVQSSAPQYSSAWPAVNSFRKSQMNPASFQPVAWGSLPQSQQQQQHMPSKQDQNLWAMSAAHPRQLSTAQKKMLAPTSFHLQQQHSQAIDLEPQNSTRYDSEPKGGVSVKLDYSIDVMAEFLCNMSTKIMGLPNHPSQAFVKFTHQLLSSTRLPCSTIMLSLVYLGKRCQLRQSSTSMDHATQYFLLIVSLVLANKFNDDNTFTNKSWSEVTGLPISDLTKFESSWLQMIDWKLNLSDSEMMIWSKWYNHWLDFVIRSMKKSASRGISPARLSNGAPHPSDSWYDIRGPQDNMSRHRSGFVNSFGSFGALPQQQQQQQVSYPQYGEIPMQQRLYISPPPQQLSNMQLQMFDNMGTQHVSHMDGLMHVYSAHCNCNYCLFEHPIVAWAGPATAAC
ncbi:uncharacterized protein V1516DRAFT_620573 [Lipomyces oligophaga]|uniref:uncharacterized protein n=1 Tax=Lipomyces oligophaga TaxID=45792 RepID=UPI0034CE0730